MPNPALPNAIDYIVSIAKLPDNTALDFTHFHVHPFEGIIASPYGKTRKIKISPKATSGYYGVINVFFNPIDWAVWPALDYSAFAEAFSGDKLTLLDAVSEYLGVIVEPSDVVNDATVLLEDLDQNEYFTLTASESSVLWAGSLKLLTRVGPEAVPFFTGVVIVQTMLLVSCSVNVTLVANVTGDLTGHTFEWDQVSGTPVYWLEGKHQLEVMFQQPTQRDDKVFRFYIDRGLVTELTRDILVTAVATDHAPTQLSSYTTSMRILTDGEESTNARFIPAISAFGTGTSNNPNRILTWDFPTSPYYNRTTLVNANTGQVVATNTFKNYITDIVSGVAYNLVTYIDIYGILRDNVINGLVYTGATSLKGDVDATDAAPTTLGSATVTMSVLETIRLELTALAPTADSATLTLASVTLPMSVLEVIRLELANLQPTDETAVNSLKTVAAPMSILEIISMSFTSLG